MKYISPILLRLYEARDIDASSPQRALTDDQTLSRKIVKWVIQVWKHFESFSAIMTQWCDVVTFVDYEYYICDRERAQAKG